MNTFYTLVLAGFTFGIVGSLHCVGMCGPIALILPVSHLQTFYRRIALLLYNIGRASSYAIFGLLISIIGKGFSAFIIQQRLSILAGLLILFYFIITYLPVKKSIPKFDYISTFIQNKITKFLRSPQSISSFFILGMLNGFLPCGLVYVAMASAFVFSNTFDSMLYMFMFGMGTLPAMYSVSEFGKFLNQKIREKIKSILPFTILLMSLILLLRGMGLGIPFVSPSMKMKGQQTKTSCCHKK